MSRPFNDPTVEEAQKEIHRRLLREEKLKRIEQEEMSRLSAMGWQPPRGGPAAHRGSSVHDAADAIEVTEHKRRAFAQEAQRRAKESEAAERAPFEISGTYAPHRGPPLPGEIEAVEKRNAQIKRAEFENIARDADAFGFHTGSRMLRHYLGGTGEKVFVDSSVVRDNSVMPKAEQANQRAFIDWITRPKIEKKVVKTRVGPVLKEVESPFNRISDQLLAMSDGETLTASDYWTKVLEYPSGLAMRSDIPAYRKEADLLSYAGQAQLRSDGDFKFTRRGDEIDFRGAVRHQFDEPYDFERFTAFLVPAQKGSDYLVQGEDALALERQGMATPFRFFTEWPQEVTGTLKIMPNGNLELLGEPRWVDAEPQEWRPWR